VVETIYFLFSKIHGNIINQKIKINKPKIKNTKIKNTKENLKSQESFKIFRVI